jgi:fumarate hydratase subunit alpha
MREIHVDQVTKAVREMVMDACVNLGPDMMRALSGATRTERSPLGLAVINEIIENAELASAERIPMCQDTGTAVFFVDVGQDIHVVGGSLTDAINEGVRRGYRDGYLRASIVGDPLKRVNTRDNTPAVIHYEMVPGDTLRISFTAKGAGSENMGRLAMLKPADGKEGVTRFILETIKMAGPNACPPLVVGVGIGGSFDKVASLAKHAIMRDVGEPSRDPDVAAYERELLEKANRLGLGPQGMGGTTTALAIQVETYACHVASLPVAVNIQCHANRHREVVL